MGFSLEGEEGISGILSKFRESLLLDWGTGKKADEEDDEGKGDGDAGMFVLIEEEEDDEEEEMPLEIDEEEDEEMIGSLSELK